jgi:hypothetical protein
VSAHLFEELAPQVGVFVVEPAPEGRHGARSLLLDSAHLRAQVDGVEMHRNTARLHEVDETVGDLLAEPLLDGEPARVETHEPRQLRDAEDLVAGDVADVRDAVERQRVMLAEREERDRPFDDLAVQAGRALRPLRGKRGTQLRVAVVPGVSRSMPNAAKISPT